MGGPRPAWNSRKTRCYRGLHVHGPEVAPGADDAVPTCRLGRVETLVDRGEDLLEAVPIGRPGPHPSAHGQMVGRAGNRDWHCPELLAELVDTFDCPLNVHPWEGDHEFLTAE